MKEGELLPPGGDGIQPIQQLAPTPTPEPSPPFHETMAPTLADLSKLGRGLGDARLNALVPAMFHQLETTNRNLQHTAEKLRAEKDLARDQVSDLREKLARRDGDVSKLEADITQLRQTAKNESTLTKLALTTAAFLIPIGYQLLEFKILIGAGTIAFGVAAASIGLYPKFLKILGLGETK